MLFLYVLPLHKCLAPSWICRCKRFSFRRLHSTNGLHDGCHCECWKIADYRNDDGRSWFSIARPVCSMRSYDTHATQSVGTTVWPAIEHVHSRSDRFLLPIHCRLRLHIKDYAGSKRPSRCTSKGCARTSYSTVPKPKRQCWITCIPRDSQTF